MRSSTCLFGLTVVATALIGVHATAAPSLSSDLFVLESLPNVPEGWHQGASVRSSARLRFRIAVKHENAFAFEQHVIDISTPDHPKYGQHMKRDELKAVLSPSFDASAAILTWLTSQGVPPHDIEDDGDWINFHVGAVEAERILDTKFHYYSDSASTVKAIRTLRYSIPQKLTRYIQMIQPTTRFSDMRPQDSQIITLIMGPTSEPVALNDQNDGFNATFCNTTITIDCLKYLYHMDGYQGKADKANTVGIGGFLEQWAKYNDFATFSQHYAPYASNQSFKTALVNGGLSTQDDPTDNDGEANLDVQYTVPLSYPAETTYYSTGGRGELVPDGDQPTLAENQNEPYLEFLQYMLALPDSDLPNVITISYGENEQSVPRPYANRTCNLFAQLGARGVSVLVASGDAGVGRSCQTNDGKNTTRFLPGFPASCPFVTAVGGTYRVQPERGVAFSGGGFSDYFPRPSYQDAAVTEYLGILGDSWKGLYNPAGRGIPDLAAQSYNFTIIDKGRVGKVGGTSCSAPVVAGIISQLNGARLASGRPPLGFLNPFIYSIGHKGLTDIVEGGSKGCGSIDPITGLPAPLVLFAGWNATKGWDAVTGHGTPDFPKLLRLARGYRVSQGGYRGSRYAYGGY